MSECTAEKSTSTFTIGQIVRQFGQSFVDCYHPNGRIVKTLAHIGNCRTASLGGHLVRCTACGYEKVVYNSCGDSNCPRCQNMKKELWIDKMSHHLLPVKHYHVIFTIPHQLNELFFYNQRQLYGLLFRAAWQTIEQVSAQGLTGMVATLHSWGSNLSYHPHLHCIVPGGAFDGEKWREKTGASQRFFVDSKVLREAFQENFIKGLKALLDYETLYESGLSVLDATAIEKTRRLIKKLERIKWCVRIEAPVLGVQQIIEYLGRYVKRVAITDSRIVEITDKEVRFQYNDYKHQEKGKAAPKEFRTMSGEAFLQQFTQHFLPPYFHRVHYYGLYAFTNKAKKQAAYQVLTGESQASYQPPLKRQLLEKMLGIDPDVCPDCACYMTLQTEILAAGKSLFFLKTVWLQPAVRLRRPSKASRRIKKAG